VQELPKSLQVIMYSMSKENIVLLKKDCE